MDKLILVLYVDVGTLDGDEAGHYVEYVGKSLFPEDVVNKLEATTFVIPRSGGGTVIECINPKYIVDSDAYKNYCLKLDELNEQFAHFIKEKKELDGKS